MKIVIIGGGKVGRTIASQLTREGHDITVIDQSRQVADRISDSLDCMALCGSGASLELLRAAGVDKSELVIACTAQDELNMLCCVFARKLGCPQTIARVRSPEYAEQMYFFKDELGLSMTVNPEFNAAEEIFRLMEIPGVLKRDTFARGRVEIVEVIPKQGDALDGAALMELPKKLKCRLLVGAVQRGDEVVIPDGSFTLRAGDKVYLCAPATELVHILRSLGEYKKKAKNILIIGASRVADYLTSMLLKADAAVKLIESSPDKAREFAAHFPEAEVVCADGSSEAVLREERADRVDAVAALTNIDEENLILSLYLSSQGVPQVIAKVDHTEFGNLFSGQGGLISPKRICANTIVRYVRAMQNTEGSSVLALHHLVDGKVDALEFNVNRSCRHLGEMLKDIRLKPNILIASINRMGQVIIPRGTDTLTDGDTVVVITASSRVILDLNDIFADEE